MVKIEDSIVIKRSVDKVFAYTTDAKNWPKWQSFIPEAEQTSQGPLNVGTTFKGVSRVMGRSMKWTAVVTEYELNKRFAKSIASGDVAIEEHFDFSPVEGGTAFTIVYELAAGGFVKLLLPMMVRSMGKETQKSLANLKSTLESSSR